MVRVPVLISAVATMPGRNRSPRAARFRRSSASFTRDHFWSAENAVRGAMYSREGWEHPPGSNLVGWAKNAINSRVVYLQPGDGPAAYDSPDYRRLVENAIRWVA